MGNKKPTKKADNGPQKLSVQQGTGTDSDASDKVESIEATSERYFALQFDDSPMPTDATKAGTTGEDSLAMVDGSATSTNPAPFPTDATRDGRTETPSTQATATTPQITDGAGDKGMGDVASLPAVTVPSVGVGLLDSLPFARARDNETRKQCWERLRQEARTAGMTRRDSVAYAGRMVEQVWSPPPEPEVEDPEPIPPEPEAVALEPEPEFTPMPEGVFPSSFSPIPSDQGVPGLGTIPEGWPRLPANASLQAEIAWVSANRLLVRDGNGVDLSRAISPAPSYSALSWLETSILFPSKFADISVKATQNQEDEAQHVRREKLAIDEIRALLAEMMEDD